MMQRKYSTLIRCQADPIILLFSADAVLSALLGNQSKTRMFVFFQAGENQHLGCKCACAVEMNFPTMVYEEFLQS
ncbi:hypothetical protein [Lampropedia hyalina]|jgi:hypothetical protein|uniref:hypothetical protein n=1 Tax=Lampropedia hyalina TaxID=198706 RepID=UPI000933C1F3|nr:hypothetical protein [Lampropedia hyalina]